jgi:hypothetical protein
MPWTEVEKFKCVRCGKTVTLGYTLPSSPDKVQALCHDCAREVRAELKAARDKAKPKSAANKTPPRARHSRHRG